MTAARRLAWAAIAIALAIAAPRTASAKKLGFSTPGRNIYGSHETFGEAFDQRRRKWVAEVALGSGSEGTLGVTLGYLLNKPQGLEFYVGFGSRLGPVLHYSASTRYFIKIFDYRGYLGGGYILQQHTNLDMISHSAFVDGGFKWIIRPTFHMTLSVGVQQLLSRSILDGSVLKGPEVDPELLEQELDSIYEYRFLASLRFSRAF